MKLTHSEANEPLWIKLKAHFTAERDKVRLKNEAHDVDPPQTAAYRAQIRLLNQILDMEVKPKDQ